MDKPIDVKRRGYLNFFKDGVTDALLNNVEQMMIINYSLLTISKVMILEWLLILRKFT